VDVVPVFCGRCNIAIRQGGEKEGWIDSGGRTIVVRLTCPGSLFGCGRVGLKYIRLFLLFFFTDGYVIPTIVLLNVYNLPVSLYALLVLLQLLFYLF
jgi:hypothetical protein